MTRVAYINGHFTPHHDACVHVEERGLQFSDGVYEVIALMQGKLIDMEGHLERLNYSLKGLSLRNPLSPKILHRHIMDLVRINRYKDGLVYIQISRGSTARKFPLPTHSTPSVIITVRPLKHRQLLDTFKDGVGVISMEDPRWSRPDIKTVSLLASALAKQKAMDAGVYDAIFTKNGCVTEGSSGNVWAVKDGVIYTHPAGQAILNGITKKRFLLLAKEKGIEAVEKPLTLEEFCKADEVFWTSASVIALPIVKIDNALIGSGKLGPITQALQHAYFNYVESL